MAPKNIDLGPIIEASAQDPLWAARGKAINSYATVEQILCNIMSQAGKMPIESAGTIFFKLNNARARNDILEKFVRRATDGKYSLFWNSIIKLVGELDGTRNEVAHWATCLTVDMGKDPVGWTLHLVPGNLSQMDENSPMKSATDLEGFSAKCHFVQTNCVMFMSLLLGQMDVAMQSPWMSVFQQAVTYPPPDTHPLSQNYAGQQSQPPPFPGPISQMIKLTDSSNPRSLPGHVTNPQT